MISTIHEKYKQHGHIPFQQSENNVPKKILLTVCFHYENSFPELNKSYKFNFLKNNRNFRFCKESLFITSDVKTSSFHGYLQLRVQKKILEGHARKIQ